MSQGKGKQQKTKKKKKKKPKNLKNQKGRVETVAGGAYGSTAGGEDAGREPYKL